ncbi:hypothetical protein, partial [Tolypothrix sp. VBCCA 56010]|uniref:hypothetical protein n=1 Tax=Tolypothrix sp. VBCCA 56010 TaxID=3137731 RepID=UPI003D7E93A9
SPSYPDLRFMEKNFSTKDADTLKVGETPTRFHHFGEIESISAKPGFSITFNSFKKCLLKGKCTQ